MALDFRLVDVPLVGGIDTKTAPFVTKPPKLLSLVNAVMTKYGRIQSRNGSVALVSNSAQPVGPVVAFEDELLQDGLTNVSVGAWQQYSLSESSSLWQQKGSPYDAANPPFQLPGQQPCKVGFDGVTSNLYDHQAVDSATVGNITVYAYEENGYLMGTIVDETTGVEIVSNQQLGTNTNARVIAYGTTGIAIVAISAAGGLVAFTATPSNPSFTAAHGIAGFSATAVASFEARYVPAATPYIAVFACGTVSAATAIVTEGWQPDFTGTTGGTAYIAQRTIITSLAAPVRCCAFVIPGSFATPILLASVPQTTYAASGNSPITCYWLDEALASGTQIGPFTLDTPASSGSPGWGNLTAALQVANAASYVQFFYEEGGPDTANPTSPITIKTALSSPGTNGVVGTPRYHVRGLGLAGDAFRWGQYPTPLVPVVFPSKTQPTYFLMDGGSYTAGRTSLDAGGQWPSYTARFVAKMQTQSAGGLTSIPLPASLLSAPYPTWLPNTVYNLGAVVQPPSPDGYWYENTGASGTSGSSWTGAGRDGAEIYWTAEALVAGRFRLPTVTALSTGLYSAPILPVSQASGIVEVASGEMGVQQVVRNVGRAKLDFTVQPTYAKLGANLHRTGGYLSAYDGGRFAEHNFHLYPEAPAYALGCPISVVRYQAGVAQTSASADGLDEVTLVSFPPPMMKPDGSVFGSGWMIEPGSYFVVWKQLATYTAEPAEPYVIWFAVDGIGTPPPFAAAATLCATAKVSILSSDTDLDICQKVALAAYDAGIFAPVAGPGIGYSQVAGAGATLSATSPTIGACSVIFYGGVSSGVAGSYGLPAASCDVLGLLPIGGFNGSLATSGHGVSAYWSSLLTCPSGSRIMPGGYFVVPQAPSYSALVVWFKVDGIGSQPTDIPFLTPYGLNFIEVDIASNNTAAQVNGLIYDAINAAGPAVAVVTMELVPGIDGGTLSSPHTPFLIFTWSTAGTPSGFTPAFNVSASGVLTEGATSPLYNARNPNQYGIGDSGTGKDGLGIPPSSTQAIFYYRLVYEWFDQKGQIHRSQPSYPIPCIVNGTWMGNYNGKPCGGCLPRFIDYNGNSTMPSLRVTGKSNVAIVVYRTQANASVYYRASSPTQTPTYLPVGPMLSDPTVDTWVNSWAGGSTGFPSGWLDVITDAEIGANPALYTQSGAYGMAPPAPLCVLERRNRLWVVPSETPSLAWYSQAFTEGSNVAPAFNPLLTVQIPESGGRIVAMGELDEKIVFFCESRVYVMSGDGPDAFGNNSNFSAPDLLSTEYGCISAATVTSGDGVWFQSQKGLVLLDRGLVFHYGSNGELEGGAAVEDLVQGYTLTSAVVMPDRNEIRFSLSSGNVVVFQTLFRQWYEIGGWSAYGALWQGSYVYQQSGKVNQESASATTDPSGAFTWSIVTPWYSFAGIQGYQRLARWEVLMDASMSGAFTQNVWIDGNDSGSPIETRTVTPTGTPPKARVFFANPRCQSMKIQLTGTSPCAFEAQSFEVGGYRGLFRLPASQSM